MFKKHTKRWLPEEFDSKKNDLASRFVFDNEATYYDIRDKLVEYGRKQKNPFSVVITKHFLPKSKRGTESVRFECVGHKPAIDSARKDNRSLRYGCKHFKCIAKKRPGSVYWKIESITDTHSKHDPTQHSYKDIDLECAVQRLKKRKIKI